MGKEVFNQLLEDLHPLVISLSGTSNYKSLRFTQSDMVGFFNEKLLHVWMKYHEKLPYQEVKAIAIASLYNLRTKLYKKYSREVSLPEQVDIPEEAIEDSTIDYLAKTKGLLKENQQFLLELLIDPPLFISEKITRGKRIPSNLILEYLGIPVDKQSVKKLNSFRRGLFTTLENRVQNNA